MYKEKLEAAKLPTYKDIQTKVSAITKEICEEYGVEDYALPKSALSFVTCYIFDNIRFSFKHNWQDSTFWDENGFICRIGRKDVIAGLCAYLKYKEEI